MLDEKKTYCSNLACGGYDSFYAGPSGRLRRFRKPIGLGSQEGKCLIHTGGKGSINPWGGDQTAFTESMVEAGKSVSDYLGNGGFLTGVYAYYAQKAKFPVPPVKVAVG